MQTWWLLLTEEQRLYHAHARLTAYALLIAVLRIADVLVHSHADEDQTCHGNRSLFCWNLNQVSCIAYRAPEQTDPEYGPRGSHTDVNLHILE